MSMLTEGVLFFFFVLHKIMVCVIIGILHLTKSIINSSLFKLGLSVPAIKSFHDDIACSL